MFVSGKLQDIAEFSANILKKKNVTNQVCPATLLEDIRWPGATDHRFPGQIKSPSNSEPSCFDFRGITDPILQP